MSGTLGAPSCAQSGLVTAHLSRIGAMLRVAAATVLIAGGIGLRRLMVRWRLCRRIVSLINVSSQQHKDKEYDASMESAREAHALAAAEPPSSPIWLRASLHLAGLYHATNRFDEALGVLEGMESKTEDEDFLIPVLHAKAEVLDGMGKPLSLAAAELARAREIRRRTEGTMSIGAGAAAFNLASVLVRQAQESAPVSDPRIKAHVALMHSVEQVLALMQQAEDLVLEAHRIALNANDMSQAAEYVGEVLGLLKAHSGPAVKAEPIVRAAAESLAERLTAAYQEALGEECTSNMRMRRARAHTTRGRAHATRIRALTFVLTVVSDYPLTLVLVAAAPAASLYRDRRCGRCR